MQSLVQTFLDLAAIDEMYPNEDKVLTYVERRLKQSDTPYSRDEAGNIVARIQGSGDETLGLCGHVDIAAPLMGRKVTVTDDEIKTDGVALLGGDDKTAVAALLELATEIHGSKITPKKSLELIFTVGEEAGLLGAKRLDIASLKTQNILVFDWLGSVSNIVLRSPAYYKLDVEYIGKDAHPAQWQQGVNAGQALMRAASDLRQGDYTKDVIFNIGIVNIGNARNKIPGQASLKAELRSYDRDAVKTAVNQVATHFRSVAESYGAKPVIKLEEESGGYELDQKTPLFAQVNDALRAMKLGPKLEATYGCFDGNIFAGRGKTVINMGAGYYNPHSPDETVNLHEFTQMFEFICRVAGVDA